MNRTIKQSAKEESHKVQQSISEFRPYGSISHITDIGSIAKMYNHIRGGHKARAKKIYGTLPTYSRSRLPMWVADYFIDDTVFLTFDEWKMFGRHVKQGETSSYRNTVGRAVFNKTQTAPFKNTNKPIASSNEFSSITKQPKAWSPIKYHS